MGLERRGSGLYFYRKERRGKRVVSIYSGGGGLAKCFHILDQAEREEALLEKERKRRLFEAEKEIQTEIDQMIDAFCEDAKAFEDAILLINGYHKHSRTWRRRKDAYKDKD